MRKPLPAALAAALALALAAPLAFSQSTALRATVTNVTPTNGSTATTSSGSTVTTSGATSSSGAAVTTSTSNSLRPPPVTDPVNSGTTSTSGTGTTANTTTTGTTTATADGSTVTGTTSGTATGSTTLTRNPFVGGAAGLGINVPIPQDAGPGRALTHEEEQALRDRLRAERALATQGNGNGLIVMSPGTPQARVMTVTTLEQDRAAKRAAQKTKAVPRNGQLNNMIVPRTDNDRTNQMPDDPIVRY